VTTCHQLKLEAADGKRYLTDVASPETILRIIQSVPSPKAEPIKSWLAKVGYERIQDMNEPARSLDRALNSSRKPARAWLQARVSCRRGRRGRN
jgi:DNA-damage-inducible protein D